MTNTTMSIDSRFASIHEALAYVRQLQSRRSAIWCEAGQREGGMSRHPDLYDEYERINAEVDVARDAAAELAERLTTDIAKKLDAIGSKRTADHYPVAEVS